MPPRTGRGVLGEPGATSAPAALGASAPRCCVLPRRSPRAQTPLRGHGLLPDSSAAASPKRSLPSAQPQRATRLPFARPLLSPSPGWGSAPSHSPGQAGGHNCQGSLCRGCPRENPRYSWRDDGAVLPPLPAFAQPGAAVPSPDPSNAAPAFARVHGSLVSAFTAVLLPPNGYLCHDSLQSPPAAGPVLSRLQGSARRLTGGSPGVVGQAG